MDEENIFDESNIQNSTKFKNGITNINGDNLEDACKLVKFKEKPLIIFCDVDENIPEGEYSLCNNYK